MPPSIERGGAQTSRSVLCSRRWTSRRSAAEASTSVYGGAIIVFTRQCFLSPSRSRTLTRVLRCLSRQVNRLLCAKIRLLTRTFTQRVLEISCITEESKCLKVLSPVL
ncbi:unnamed protein product [Acanthoscelides obtectus]|uniref:Uncharacterized protein n=1 Tax=Acanthoscelides obtectus TaxID=200917 RepID=A0A9P0P8S5_ACAOB|nr:unnamed protein product [Acanthoscelides obtectus]CAK1635514.1 hypothetical protein AOBTE_LOCUS9329 [Acanthoscelides obtectus]